MAFFCLRKLFDVAVFLKNGVMVVARKIWGRIVEFKPAIATYIVLKNLTEPKIKKIHQTFLNFSVRELHYFVQYKQMIWESLNCKISIT